MMTERAAKSIDKASEVQNLEQHGILRAEGGGGSDYLGREFSKVVPDKAAMEEAGEADAGGPAPIVAAMEAERAQTEEGLSSTYGDLNQHLQDRATGMVANTEAAVAQGKT